MTTIVLIKEAIAALKDRTGSSIPAITKWLETEKKVRRFELEIAEYHSQGGSRNRTFLHKMDHASEMGKSITRPPTGIGT